MVLDELIPMLGEQGLDTSRVGFLGWSMGGYGALLLGARLGPARTAAICAVSPALWTSSGATAPGAFDGADDYAANSVWGLPALAPSRSGSTAATVIRSIRRPSSSSRSCPAPRGRLLPGGHDSAFWSSQLPAEIAWMAPLLSPDLEADPSLGRGQADVGAEVAARQRIDTIACRRPRAPRPGRPRFRRRRAPDRRRTRPRRRRARVPACSTPSASEPVITSPTRGRAG